MSFNSYHCYCGKKMAKNTSFLYFCSMKQVATFFLMRYHAFIPKCFSFLTQARIWVSFIFLYKTQVLMHYIRVWTTMNREILASIWFLCGFVKEQNIKHSQIFCVNLFSLIVDRRHQKKIAQVSSNDTLEN